VKTRNGRNIHRQRVYNVEKKQSGEARVKIGRDVDRHIGLSAGER